jgi:membrane protein
MRVSDFWKLLHEGIDAYIVDEAMSRGAAIAFYAITALAPLLYIAAMAAGLVFGRQAAGSAITAQVGHLMGLNGYKILQVAILNADNDTKTSIWANIVGVALLIVTASGIFGEMQAALNAIWKVQPKTTLWWRLIRVRFVSLGLVLALSFLLLASLVMSAAINALGARIQEFLPIGLSFAWTLNFAVSFVLVALLLAAIYKILPDCDLEWRDVLVGAIGTTVLFDVGEYLIGLYLASSTIGSRYGAAGGILVMLLWIYYTTQIFLLGAEFTRVWSLHRGSRAELFATRDEAVLSVPKHRI